MPSYLPPALLLTFCQGSATVGVKNATHAVVVALKRAPSELSDYQKKVFKVDDHVAISIAGLTADARSLKCVWASSHLPTDHIHACTCSHTHTQAQTKSNPGSLCLL